MLSSLVKGRKFVANVLVIIPTPHLPLLTIINSSVLHATVNANRLLIPALTMRKVFTSQAEFKGVRIQV